MGQIDLTKDIKHVFKSYNKNEKVTLEFNMNAILNANETTKVACRNVVLGDDNNLFSAKNFAVIDRCWKYKNGKEQVETGSFIVAASGPMVFAMKPDGQNIFSSNFVEYKGALTEDCKKIFAAGFKEGTKLRFYRLKSDALLDINAFHNYMKESITNFEKFGFSLANKDAYEADINTSLKYVGLGTDFLKFKATTTVNDKDFRLISTIYDPDNAITDEASRKKLFGALCKGN